MCYPVILVVLNLNNSLEQAHHGECRRAFARPQPSLFRQVIRYVMSVSWLCYNKVSLRLCCLIPVQSTRVKCYPLRVMSPKWPREFSLLLYLIHLITSHPRLLTWQMLQNYGTQSNPQAFPQQCSLSLLFSLHPAPLLLVWGSGSGWLLTALDSKTGWCASAPYVLTCLEIKVTNSQ
jgi:hypothetical protein